MREREGLRGIDGTKEKGYNYGVISWFIKTNEHSSGQAKVVEKGITEEQQLVLEMHTDHTAVTISFFVN